MEHLMTLGTQLQRCPPGILLLISYKKIIQLGENPRNVFITGGLGVDAIKKSKIISKNDLEKNINSHLIKKILITYHSETQ